MWGSAVQHSVKNACIEVLSQAKDQPPWVPLRVNVNYLSADFYPVWPQRESHLLIVHLMLLLSITEATTDNNNTEYSCSLLSHPSVWLESTTSDCSVMNVFVSILQQYMLPLCLSLCFYKFKSEAVVVNISAYAPLQQGMSFMECFLFRKCCSCEIELLLCGDL